HPGRPEIPREALACAAAWTNHHEGVTIGLDAPVSMQDVTTIGAGVIPMATFPTTKPLPEVQYPTGDGQPVGETPIHRDNLLGLIELLRRHFAGDRMVYISGIMFLYYVPGRKRRHVSPDVFVVRGIPDRDRDAYFVWEEGKGPDVVFEFTSASTSDEDLDEK